MVLQDCCIVIITTRPSAEYELIYILWVKQPANTLGTEQVKKILHTYFSCWENTFILKLIQLI